jgi:hypothetical protein
VLTAARPDSAIVLLLGELVVMGLFGALLGGETGHRACVPPATAGPPPIR